MAFAGMLIRVLSSGASPAGIGARYAVSVGGDYSTVNVSKFVLLPLVATVTVHGRDTVAYEQP